MAYFHEAKIVLRRSRLPDMDGDEPTDDAFLLARWMLSRPVGNTAYPEQQACEGSMVAPDNMTGAIPDVLAVKA